MIYTVEVGVALTRPPTVQQYRYYVIEAVSGYDAELIAQQIAGCSSVMPVESLVTGWEEDA